jgi:hypothetical protein
LLAPVLLIDVSVVDVSFWGLTGDKKYAVSTPKSNGSLVVNMIMLFAAEHLWYTIPQF